MAFSTSSMTASSPILAFQLGGPSFAPHTMLQQLGTSLGCSGADAFVQRNIMAIRRRRRSKSLAAQTVELGFAAPQVIAHRLARMASAGTSPSARDRAEFHRMGVEKIAAANEAWTAMATQAFLENQKLALSVMQSFWFPWMRPTQRKLNKAAMDILAKGIAPVRRRAVANAKRLGRIK